MDREPYQPGLARNNKLVEQLQEWQRNPRSLVFISLADSYRAENLPHQALEIIEEGLSVHPGLASAVLAKARCLFDLRRFAEAAAVCREIIERNPENIKAHKLQAEIYLRLGQRRAAIRALTEVVSLYPNDLEAVKELEALENLESSLIVPVERLSRASSDSPPPSPPGRIVDFQVGSFRESLASITEQEKKEESAKPTEEEVLEISVAAPVIEREDSSEPAFATRTIAELYLRQGLNRKAERVLRKILQEDPANLWARETLQELRSDGIVLPAPKSDIDQRKAALTARAKFLERFLAQVRLRKTV